MFSNDYFFVGGVGLLVRRDTQSLGIPMRYIVGARNIALHEILAILSVNDRGLTKYRQSYT
jgi:hypothetical protein